MSAGPHGRRLYIQDLDQARWHIRRHAAVNIWNLGSHAVGMCCGRCRAGIASRGLALRFRRCGAELTRKQLRRGVHTSTSQLEADIRAFIERHNENPKPYRWTKSADEILSSVKRFCQKARQTLCGEL